MGRLQFEPNGDGEITLNGKCGWRGGKQKIFVNRLESVGFGVSEKSVDADNPRYLVSMPFPKSVEVSKKVVVVR